MEKITVFGAFIQYGPAVLSIIIGLGVYIYNARNRQLDIRMDKHEQENEKMLNELFNRMREQESKSSRLCERMEGQEKICVVKHTK